MSVQKIGIAALIAACCLAGCGGGEGGNNDSAYSTTASTTAEGVYSGVLTSGPNTAFDLLVLEDGSYWGLYGAQTNSSFLAAGFIQGTGWSNDGTFTSSNTKDFGLSPAVYGSVNATYNSGAGTITGSVTESVGTVNFIGGPSNFSSYNYNTPASLSTVVGSWTVSDMLGESIALNISPSGTFTANGSSGCNFSGTITPRPSGKNVFNVTMTFGAYPCALAGQSASGIALAYPYSAGNTQLMVAAIDATRTYGTIAFGTR